MLYIADKLIRVRDAAVTARQERFTPKKLPLCSAISHPAMQAIGLVLLVGSAGPVAQNLVARELKAGGQFFVPRTALRVPSNASRTSRRGPRLDREPIGVR